MYCFLVYCIIVYCRLYSRSDVRYCIDIVYYMYCSVLYYSVLNRIVYCMTVYGIIVYCIICYCILYIRYDVR